MLIDATHIGKVVVSDVAALNDVQPRGAEMEHCVGGAGTT